MSTAHRKFTIAGFSAVAALVVGLVGCDSTPGPPADSPPSVQKEPTPTGKTGRQIPKSIKNRPQPASPDAAATPTTPAP